MKFASASRHAAAVFAVMLAFLFSAPPGDAFGQGRPRRVDPSNTAPAPGQRPSGQQSAPEPDVAADDEPLQLEGALIEVPTVVSDRSGHYVPRLRQEDFRVLEDGQPQQLSFFTSERVPIHVAIVMDTSGSARDTIGDIQEAAIDFIGQLLPGDQVLIVSFSDQVIIEQEFTSDRGRLAQAVRRTQARGSTKLYDAVYLTVAERLAHIEGRKAMIILSDGEDTASEDATAEEAVNVCSESDVVVYGIRYPESGGAGAYRQPRNGGPNSGPNNGPFPGNYPQPRRRGGFRFPGMPRIPGVNWPLVASPLAPQVRVQWPGGGTTVGKDPFMEAITSNSGGSIFYADAVSDVGRLFRTIAEELRYVYIIGYSPSNPLSAGGYRRITVQVPSRPELAIRHRLGYKAADPNRK